MTALTAAHAAYKASRRKNRGDLWTLCIAVYNESETKTVRSISDKIGENEDTVTNWGYVGELVAWCDGYEYQVDEATDIDLLALWEHYDLSYDHLLRVAKLARKYEIDPEEILERLYNAATGKQEAQSLERDIEETHEPQDVLLRRDMKRIYKRLEQNVDSLALRGAPFRVVRAMRFVLARMKKEISAG